MLDRLIMFLVLGFFVFSPSIPDWSQGAAGNWVGIFGFWVVVIFLAFLSSHATGTTDD
ncbi:MAG: hypothetical protein O2780_00485 [Proteobacteria bacterium]|jgi:hypothetical protein|nr:hypothetical protein [Pseudomonadota bacterium]MDA1300306.1 hypothetical protein [Pseudomonadota bacterium]